MTKQAEADYQMVVKWMGDKVIERQWITPVLAGGSGLVFNPKEDLNCWTFICDNMTVHDRKFYFKSLNKTFFKDPPSKFPRFFASLKLHNCPAEVRYSALVEMIKES